MRNKKIEKVFLILVLLIIFLIITMFLLKSAFNIQPDDLIMNIIIIVIGLVSLSIITIGIITIIVTNKKRQQKFQKDMDLKNLPKNDDEAKFIFKTNFYVAKFTDIGIELAYSGITLLLNYYNIEAICFHDVHATTKKPIFTIIFKANSDDEELSFPIMLTSDLLYVINKYNIKVENIDIINKPIIEKQPIYKKTIYMGTIWKNIAWTFVIFLSPFLLTYYFPHLFLLFILFFIIPVISCVCIIIFKFRFYEIREDSLKIYNLSDNVHYFHFSDITTIEILELNDENRDFINAKEKIVIDLIDYLPNDVNKDMYVITTFQGIYILQPNEELELALKAYFKDQNIFINNK